MDVGRCWWAQVAACGMRRCLRTLVAVCAAFSGAREHRLVLRTPPPFRAAHGACRSACPLAARPHPPVVVRASPPARWPHAPRPSAAPRAAPPLDIPPQRCYYNIALRGGIAVRGASDWVWRSLVACLNGVQEAGGSNPLTQTTASEQSPLCSDVFFASGRCICRKKAAVAPLPCSSFSAKGPARLACSLASALTTARCRYQPFAAPAPCGSNRGALWRERACWTVRARWRGNEPAKHIATIHAHGQGSGREGDGQAGMDATGRRRACACCWARAAPMPTRPGRARRRSSPRRRRRPPCCAARRRGRAGRNGSFFLPTTARCATMLTAGAHAPRRFPAAGIRFGAHIPFRRNDGTGRRDGLKIRW